LRRAQLEFAGRIEGEEHLEDGSITSGIDLFTAGMPGMAGSKMIFLKGAGDYIAFAFWTII